jgi:glycosyltransferase involved in cell wall biosynthesis
MIDRIATINDSSVPRGGATMLAVEATVGLAGLGYNTSFLSGDNGDNPDMMSLGTEVVGMGERAARELPQAQVLMQGLYSRKSERFISDWINRHDTPGTVYHLHTWAQIFSPSIFLALRPVMDRLVLSGHDFFHVCPNGSYSFLKTGKMCGKTPMSLGCLTAQCDRKNYGYKVWRVGRQLVRNTLMPTKSSVPMLAIHERMRPLFVQGGLNDNQIFTVPNPIRPFLPRRVAVEANDELVFIGRMETTKGPDLAAAAARSAGVKMRFIGGGKLSKELSERYPEMMFDGFTPREQIPSLLTNARALIMPSRYAEPYGLVAVEAMWSGIPVIIADAAFLAPDIEKCGAGIACASTDEYAMTLAIAALFGSDDLAAKMSHAAFEKTRNLGHTPESWLSELVKIYQRVLATANS